MDFLNTPKFNLPPAPKATGTGVNAGALLAAPFKAIGNLFSPSTTNFAKPTNPLAGLGNGYNPLQSFQAPAMNFPTLNKPTQTLPIAGPTQNGPLPVSSATPTLPKAPSGDMAIQGSLPSTKQVQLPSGITVTVDSQGNVSNLPAPVGPTSFGNNSPTTDGYIPSTTLGSSTTYQDVLNKRADYQKAYEDALLKSVDVQNQGLQNVENARYSGETQPYATGMTERVQRNADLASLAATNRANAFGKLLDVSQQNVGNVLGAQATNQGLQTSANGDVFSQSRNPTTGATELTSYGNIYNGTFNGQPQTGGPISQAPGVQQSTSALPSANGQVSNVQVPIQLQGAVFTAPNGQAYVSQDRLTPGLQTMQTIAAKNAGIPVLSSDQVASVRNVDYVKQQIGGIKAIVGNILTSGTAGRIKGLLVNPIKQFLQNDTDISTFNAYRETAINTIQSLAGGSGSGLRLTTGEIAQASSNIPEITDNLETANAKLDKLNTFLDNKMATILPPSAGGTKTSSTGSSIIQTKVGAVDNSWF